MFKNAAIITVGVSATLLTVIVIISGEGGRAALSVTPTAIVLSMAAVAWVILALLIYSRRHSRALDDVEARLDTRLDEISVNTGKITDLAGAIAEALGRDSELLNRVLEIVENNEGDEAESRLRSIVSRQPHPDWHKTRKIS